MENWTVFMVEGGELDGSVLLRNEGGVIRVVERSGDIVLASDKTLSQLKQSTLVQASDGFHRYEDAATIALFVAERERLIRSVCGVTKKTGVPSEVLWHGIKVADVLSSGDFVRFSTPLATEQQPAAEKN